MASIMYFVFGALCLFVSFQSSRASYHEQYRVPVSTNEASESFVFNEIEYVVHKLAVRFEDADHICRGRYNGSLAITDSLEKAEFLAEALAESQLGMDSAWVGARRSSAADPDGFRWIAGSHMPLERSSGDVQEYRRTAGTTRVVQHFPSWMNRTLIPVTEEGANCVALARVYHDQPAFVDLPCGLERPFVCETDAKNDERITPLKSVRCKSGLYRLFHGRVSWERAAAFCLMNRMALANVGSNKCIKKLGMRMMKSRPGIEAAWIGGKGTLGSWAWIDSGANIDASTTDVAEWPPFREPNDRKQAGCLLIDRHATDSPVFLEARCERKMDFICYEAAHKTISTAAQPSDDLHYYVLVRQSLYWSHALDNCARMHGVLAGVEDAAVVTQLLLAMGENADNPVNSIWVAGRLNSTKDINSDTVTHRWYNPITGHHIPDPNNPGEKTDFMPPWWDESPSTDNACLNLDRENHQAGLVYGMPCDTPQNSICMIDKKVMTAKVQDNDTIGDGNESP